jgi:recombination protein RecA
MREKVGVMYGNPETTPGGKALKFYASVRLDIRKVENLKNGTDIYGSHVRCKVVKNKVAPPFKTAEFDILYGQGISKASEILDMAVTFEIIEKSGAWFSYAGQRIGQGKDNARKFLDDNPEISAEIERLVREKAAKMRDSDFEEGDDETLDIRLLDMDEDGDDLDLGDDE